MNTLNAYKRLLRGEDTSTMAADLNISEADAYNALAGRDAWPKRERQRQREQMGARR